MKITILTLFPEFFTSFFNTSIIKRAISKELIEFEIINIRDYTVDKHKRVDNPPYGGGAGLIMMCQPVIDALKSTDYTNSKIILTSPKGNTFNQKKAIELSKEKHLTFICGHYEGLDARIEDYVDESISVGDFVLTGGEVAILSIIDATIRLIPDVITSHSIDEESFNDNLLEYPQYSFPYEYDNKKVPDILFSGNHEAIKKWQRKQSLSLTKKCRPDLFNKLTLTKQDIKLLKEVDDNIVPKWEISAIEKGKKFIKK